jgi:hypothetical protein
MTDTYNLPRINQHVLTCPSCKSEWLHRSDHIQMTSHKVALAFWCESCTKGHTLVIKQHKGQTTITWQTPQLDDPTHPALRDPGTE